MKAIGVPIGFVLQPFAEPKELEEGVPLAESLKGPIRCSRCNAYLNCFFRFEGYTGVCNICKFPNQLSENFQASTANPELSKAVFDLIAPIPQYKNMEITPIHLLFVIELSISSLTLGVPQQVLASISAILETLPAPDRTQIGFLTYESTHLTYYKCKDSTRDVQEIVVAEIDEECVPISTSEMFLNVSTEIPNIRLIIEKLNKRLENFLFENPQAKAGMPMGAAFANAIASIKPNLGRALVFVTQPPTVGFGKIQKRKDESILAGTDKEKTLFIPQIEEYSKLGKTCSNSGISLDLFAFNIEGFDLATISETSKISGGTLTYFPSYAASTSSEKLHFELARNLTRNYAFDCIMTMRSSQGLVLSEYYTTRGKVLVRDLEMGGISSDTTIAVVLQQEEKIVDPESYVQFALLHTNIFGQRVIRVINLVLQVDSSIRSDLA